MAHTEEGASSILNAIVPAVTMPLVAMLSTSNPATAFTKLAAIYACVYLLMGFLVSKEYGLAIGRNLELNCRKGLMTRDLTTNAMVIASAGADARMAGAPVSVVANSGSGNQGITATMPVVATARWLDIDEEKMLRAVTLSNLIAIRIKAKFGRLSNLCGATVAATGAPRFGWKVRIALLMVSMFHTKIPAFQ